MLTVRSFMGILKETELSLYVMKQVSWLQSLY